MLSTSEQAETGTLEIVRSSFSAALWLRIPRLPRIICKNHGKHVVFDSAASQDMRLNLTNSTR